MVTDLEHLALYWSLRNQVLTRFFAFGRYFRCNYLSTWNELGVVRRPDSEPPGPGTSLSDNADDPRIEGQALDGSTEVIWRPTTYGPNSGSAAPKLTDLLPSAQATERWRIALHQRDNPLMLTGQLMTCLAIEYHLGLKNESLPIIREALISLKQLYKFPNSQDPRQVFCGYLLRWDPVTSDRWRTTRVNGNVVPGVCSNFALGPDGRYLYVLPKSHPAYQPRRPGIDEKSPEGSAHVAWYRQFRWQEPSFDELVGLVAAYDIVYRLVDDAWIREVVKEQLDALGTYLSGCGYLLVRPVDGFTGQGASQSGPMLEFPFGLVFKRITGSSYASQASFLDACGLAGIRGEMQLSLTPYEMLGSNLSWIFPALVGAVPLVGATAIGAAIALLGLLAPAIGPLVLAGSTLAGAVVSLLAYATQLLGEAAIGTPDGRDALFVLENGLASPSLPGAAAYAVGLLANQGLFDVRNDDQGSGFASAYALKELFPDPRQRFEVGMRLLCINLIRKPYTLGFPAYVGLTALDAQPGSPERFVADQYLHFVRRRQPMTNDEEKSFTQRGFARGVALVLGDSSQAAPIRDWLVARFGAFTSGMAPATAQPTVIDDGFTQPADPSQSISIFSSEIVLSRASYGEQNEALEYMVTLALSWLAAKRAADSGATVPDVPVFVPSSLPLDGPTVPALPAGMVPAFDGLGDPSSFSLYPLRQTPESSRPPDPPPQPPPVVSTETYVVTVAESDRDVDTGIGIQELDKVTFSATGDIWAGAAFSGRNGPDGWSEVTTNSNYPLHSGPDAHRYALLFRLSDPMDTGSASAASYRFLGKGDRPELNPYIHAGADRRIWLRINDDDPGNGNGQFTVTITVSRVAH